jgi:hydrogenase nickel incorporation protein HypB
MTSVTTPDRVTSLVVELIGPPGCGKTSLIEATTRADRDQILRDVRLVESTGVGGVPVLENVVRVAVFSVAGGDDKAVKYPHLIGPAQIVLLNKIDLLPHTRFDVEAFAAGIRRVKANMPILQVSAAHEQGMEAWLAWLASRRQRDIVFGHDRGEDSTHPEFFVG